jgi:hypothetical protein
MQFILVSGYLIQTGLVHASLYQIHRLDTKCWIFFVDLIYHRYHLNIKYCKRVIKFPCISQSLSDGQQNPNKISFLARPSVGFYTKKNPYYTSFTIIHRFEKKNLQKKYCQTCLPPLECYNPENCKLTITENIAKLFRQFYNPESSQLTIEILPNLSAPATVL